MEHKSHFLDYDKTIFFKQRIAKALGVGEALILQHINYYAETNNNVYNGKRWFYHTVENFQKSFPFYSEKTIRRILEKLERLGILMVGRFNKIKTDRTKWYCVNIEILDRVIIERTPDYLEEIRKNNQVSPSGQNDQMEAVKMGDFHVVNLTSCSFKEKKDKEEINTPQKTPKSTKTEKQLFLCVSDDHDEASRKEAHSLLSPKEEKKQLDQEQQGNHSVKQETKEDIYPAAGITSVKSKQDFSEDFLRFYSAYPKKISKGDAWKAWKQFSKKLPQIDELLAILEKHKAQEGWKNTQYIPYPASWIRGLKWEDEIDTPHGQVNSLLKPQRKTQDQGDLFSQLINKSKETGSGKD